ncbi:MAG: dTMP kinase [Deltaproteobacteria bacterium]|nr:dTMP kinase [Deltaproteobacteria bacterium]
MFVTFEGIEGCGKTTQIERFAETLKRQGIPLITTFEPGGTRIGNDIRRILLDARNEDLTPLTELILYAADRAQHIEEVIKPALDRGEWVICDRFVDATLVYQGTARSQDVRLIQILNERSTLGISPDMTFLLDCPVEIGLERAMKRNEALSDEGQDRFERETLDFHNKVRKGYLDLANEHKERIVIIDASLSMDAMEKEIFKHIEPHLRRI